MSPSSSKRRPKSGELEADAAASTSTLEPITTPRRKAKKKTQWADGGEEAQASVEIVVDDGRLAHDSDDASDEVRLHILISSLRLSCREYYWRHFKRFNQYVGVRIHWEIITEIWRENFGYKSQIRRDEVFITMNFLCNHSKWMLQSTIEGIVPNPISIQGLVTIHM